MISWPRGGIRREVCYRADKIEGPYEKKVILETPFGGLGAGVAQGTIFDTPDGEWYGMFFQDRDGLGRAPALMPCTWIDGWPILGDENGKVPEIMEKPIQGYPVKGITKSDDFKSDKLDLCWQWNHNPVDEAWSLTERPGYLRLKTARVVPNLYLAPNTITQRMEGPVCSGYICMDLTKMKDGDCAGLSAFNGDSGVLTVKKNGKNLILEMSEQKVSLTEREKAVTNVEETLVESVDITSLVDKKQPKIWLRLDGDFRPNGRRGGKDAANFYYSLDGEDWIQIGTKDYRMIFDYRRFFMGTKFGIFNYATKQSGGYVDVDWFDYKKINE